MTHPDPEEFTPLTDRILNVFGLMPFCRQDILDEFPDVNEHKAYRALEKLIKARRVKYKSTVDRKKYYSALTANSMPHIEWSGKIVPLTEMIMHIEKLYVSGQFVYVGSGTSVNRIPVLFSNLFYLATREQSDTATKKEWQVIRSELINAQRQLTKLVDWISAVTNHPAMSGDIAKFKEVFAGKDAPDYETVIQPYLIWYNANKDKLE